MSSPSKTEFTEIGSIRLLGIFRLMLAVLLSVFYLADKRLWPLDSELSIIFQLLLLFYLIFLLLSTWLWHYDFFQRNPAIFVFSIIDLLLLSGLCYYSGSPDTPLVFLILVSIMIHGAFMTLTQGLLLLGLATSLMLGLWYGYLSSHYTFSIKDFLADQILWRFSAQLMVAMGALFLANMWRHRLRVNENLLQQQEAALVEAKLLHEAIIQQVNTGLIAVSQSHEIVFANALVEAWFLKPAEEGLKLSDYSAVLDGYLKKWLAFGLSDNKPLELENGEKIHVEFIQLDAQVRSQILIVLETEEHITLRAQQTKLVALGQLTAAIAHEIRNPMTAISQAAQLIKEQARAQDSTKLIDIVLSNINRTNRIINDILNIAKKNEPNIVVFDLLPWLKQLIEEFTHTHPDAQEIIRLETGNERYLVSFDPAQLRQVVWNLLSNALIHGRHDVRKLVIIININANLSYVWLTITDNGPGFPKVHRSRLFEPFFSTHHNGTGLGLYLSHEICRTNQATLEYMDHMGVGACFRIMFAPLKLSADEQPIMKLPV